MPTIDEIRQAYPQYSDLSDDQLLSGLHRRFYSDMPFDAFASRIAPARQPEAPERGLLGTIGARAGDIAGSFVSGAGGIASGVGGLAGIAGAGFDNRLITAGRGLQEYGESLMSPELQEKRRALSEAIKAAEDQGLVAEASAALRTLASNPGLLAAMVVEQIPQFVVSGGIGRGAMAAGQIAGRTGARAAVVGAERAAAEAGARAGTAAAITSGAGLQGGEVAGQAFQDVMNLPAETLARSPAYQELLKEMTPDDARAALANRAGREAGLMGAGISAATMAALPGAEKAMFTQNVSRRAVSRVLGTSAGEAVQEGIEEGGGQFSQNVAALRADVERDLSRGVGGAAATGAVLGGIIGAGTGALSRPNVPPAQPPAAPPAAPPAPPTAGQPAVPPAAPPPSAPPAAGAAVPPAPPVPPVAPAAGPVEPQPTPQVTPLPPEVAPPAAPQVNPEYAAWEARRAAALDEITRTVENYVPEIGPDGRPMPMLSADFEIKGLMRAWDSRNPAPPRTIPAPPAAPQAEVTPPLDLVPPAGAETPTAVEPPGTLPPLFNVPVGQSFQVITPPSPGGGVMAVDVKPEVVDLYDLVEATGRLQNRNINAKPNQSMIDSIANSPDFRQLSTSQYADRGSPIVGPDNIIEVGNHRVKGLKLAAENNPEGFNNYVKSLNEAGYDTTGMKFPVLVRRRVTDLDEADRIRFVKSANKTASQELNAVEMANDDAVSLTPQIMSQFDGTLEAGIDAAKNQNFVRAFAAALVGKSELNKFMKADGTLSEDGRNRINRALFASAYQDQSLLEKAINSKDDDLKSITGAMINVVGPMQALRRELENGRVRPEFDIVPTIVSASDRIRDAKGKGMTPADLLATEDMVSPISPLEAEVIRLMSNDNMSKVASKAAITRRLKEFVDVALNQTTQPDMIGGQTLLTPQDAVRLALNPGQATMFSKAPVTMGQEEVSKAAFQKVQPGADPYSYWSDYFRGPVVYEDGEIALIEGLNITTGRPVYLGVLPNGNATKVDVDSYNGTLIKPHLLDRMRQKKSEYLEGVKKKTSGNFRGPFAPGRNIAFDVSFPEKLRGFAEGLVDTLGLGDAQILFTDIDGAENANFGPRNNLYGDFFSARSTSFINDRFGPVFGLSNSMRDRNFYVVSIDANRRLSIQIETLAHEIGHVFDKKVLREADQATMNQIMSSFQDWLKKNGNLPAPKYIQALRTAVVGKQIARGYEGLNAQQLDNYYRKFEEWFADQVGRWSLTSKPAQSLIGRFFQRIAAAYRKIVSALGDVGLPDQTVANFIEDHRQRQLPKAYPAKDVVATQGWTKKPKQMAFDLSVSARGMPEQKITSADTSVKQIPATFKRVDFAPGTVNLDYGGGRFDLGSDFMREKGVENLVYDVFNRSQEHNDGVLSRIRGERPDTVTVNNVLNVVAEPEVRDFIIQDAGQYMKPDGTAYFLIYQGDESGVGKQTAKGFQNNAKAETYIPAIKKHFGDVTRKGNLIIARDFKGGVEAEPVVEAARAPRRPTNQGQTAQAPGANLFGPGAPPPTPPTPQPNLPLGSAADFYNAVIPQMNQSSLLDRVLSTMFDKKKGESVAGAIARTSINRAAPLHNLDQMNAANGYTGRSAGQAMEISLTNTGRIAQLFTTGIGKVNPATGEIQLRNDVKPLLQIMKEAGADNEDAKKGLQVYLAALRERDLRRAGRQGFTQIPDGAVLDAIQQAEAAHPEWKQTAADLDKLNNALIDWSLDTGIIGADQAQNLRDVFYTPFYRVMEKNTMEDPARAVSPKIGESFTNVASAINRELKGGESPLGDLLTNIVLNADSIMKAGLKNLSMKTSAEAMDFANLAQKNLTGKKGENTITFKVDGKDVSYDVSDPVMFSALAGMPRNMQNGIYNTMARMASVFRDFVTVAPSFIMSNLYKGKITAYVQEGQPFFTNTFAGMRDALNASTSLQNFQLQTGFGGMEYGMESRNMAKAFERKLNDKGVMKALSQGKILSAMRQSFDKMQAISEASEMAERIKLAENLIKKGMDPKDAYFQAYLLAPYSRRGTGEGWVGSSLQFLMPLVPFLNAKLQTTYRLVENEKGDKRRLWTLGLPQQIFLRGLVVTAFSLLAYGLNLADDEDKWNKIPNYMKLNYDIIPFMGNYITLPRAFEVGQVFGALPVFMLDAIRRGEGKDLAEALVEVGKNTFFMNPMPKAFDPLVGAVTNYDFFRMRPLETKGEQALPIGERINRSTTKTGEALSSVVNMVFGDVLSPIKAQALLEGYSGTLGVTLMNGFDSILAMLGAIPGKPAGPFGDPATMPAMLANAAGFNRFYREDEAMVSRFVGDFYKIKEMTDQLVRSQNLARQNGDFERLQELRGEEGLPLRMREVVNSASTQIADINKRIRIIERRDIDGVAKAEAIRPLIAQRDRIAKRVVDRARDIGAL